MNLGGIVSLTKYGGSLVTLSMI